MENIGVYNITAFNCLLIKDIDEYDDKITVAYAYYSEMKGKTIEEKARRYKLYYSSKGTYFNFKGVRFYLNDFLRL